MNKIDLPFEKIEAMRASITSLDHLIAIFSQAHGDRFLLVYLDDRELPSLLQSNEAILLSDLPDKNLSDFDGPTAGFSVLEIVRDDVIVRGPDFFPIERFFLERNELLSLADTKQKLACYLIEHLSDFAKNRSLDTLHRTQAEIIELALPVRLLRVNCENLIAIIPAKDLNAFIKDGEAVYIKNDRNSINNLHALSRMRIDTDQDWIIALEETSIFNPLIKIDGKKFLDLRDSLRKSGNTPCLLETCRELGYACDAELGREGALETAFALLSQYWLLAEDVDDLVAFLPHKDFNHFAETGDAIRVYRTLSERARSSSLEERNKYSIQELFEKGVPSPYDHVIFCLPIVSNHLKCSTATQIFSLGNVLSKAGRIHQLARSLYMLSYFLAKGDQLLLHELGFVPDYEELIDAAFRAYLVYNVSDPWSWGSRWAIDLENTYKFLIQLIEDASLSAGKPFDLYYSALLQWLQYSYVAVDVSNLGNILNSYRRFQRISLNYPETNLKMYTKRAARFIEICEGLLGQTNSYHKPAEIPPQGDNRVEFWDANRVLKILVNGSPVYEIVTPLFLHSWYTLLEWRNQREDLRSNERDAERLIRFLRQLLMQLALERRSLFAPLHERQVLEFAYQQEISLLDSILQELESSAKLNINLKNPWLDLHQEVVLAIEIANTGQVEANGVEVRFAPPKHYQVLDEKSTYEISILQPGSSVEIYHRIRPERTDAELRLEYEFRDRRGQKHNDAWTARLNIRNLDTEPFQIKINRYQFGRPIQIPSDFYGRRSELQNILSHLRGGGQQNLLLRGPRRMGKTSMLYILQHLLKHPETRRLFEIPSSWDTELNRHHPIFLSLHAFDSYSESIQITQFFHALLDNALVTLGFETTEKDLVLGRFEQRQLQVGPVNASLEQIGRILDENPGLQIVVLLDEYDEIYRPRNGGLDRGLREFVSAEQRLTWIIASTLALYEAVKSVSSPWFNIFAIIELQRLNQKAAVDLVEKPSQGEGVVWRSDAVLDLLRETGNHPAFTQLFCEKLMEYLNESQTNYVTRETIAVVTDQIVNEQETVHSHFEFYWSDTPGVGQLILLLLNDQGVPLRRDEIRSSVLAYLDREFGNIHHGRVKDAFNEVSEWWSREFKSSLDWIDKITDAVSPDDQRRFGFSVPLFRRWLRRRALHENFWEAARDKMLKEMERDGLVQA